MVNSALLLASEGCGIVGCQWQRLTLPRLSGSCAYHRHHLAAALSQPVLSGGEES